MSCYRLLWIAFALAVPLLSQSLPTLQLDQQQLRFDVKATPSSEVLIPEPQVVKAASNGAPISFSTVSSVGWLKVSPATGLAPQSPSSSNIRVSIDYSFFGSLSALEAYVQTRCPLDPNNFNMPTCVGQITVNAFGTAIPQHTITVRFSVLYLVFCYSLSTNALEFSGDAGGQNLPDQTIQVLAPSNCQITNPVVQILAEPGQPAGWLNATVSGANVRVSVNTAGLAPGEYLAYVNVDAGAGGARVAVFLTVRSRLQVSPLLPINFSARVGSPPLEQSFDVTSAGSPLPFSISSNGSWFTVSPSSGTTPATIRVTANLQNLLPTNYEGSITVTSPLASGPVATIPVTLALSPALLLSASPTSLRFSSQLGSTQPVTQPLVLSTTSGTLQFEAQISGSSAFSATPQSGSAPAVVSVSANPTGLPLGIHASTLTLMSPGNTPLRIPLTLEITAPPSLSSSVNTLNFTGDVNGSLPTQRFDVSSSSPVPLRITATSATGWLRASASSNSTPANITITVDTQGLTAGTYTGSVSIGSTTAGTNTIAIPVILTLVLRPTLAIGGVLHAASSTAAVAPGSLISIYGANLATQIGSASSTPLPELLNGTRVTIDNAPIPLVFVSPGQINAQLPYRLAPGAASLIVSRNGVSSLPLSFTVLPNAPGIFLMGPDGQAAVQNQDGKINSETSPAGPRSFVVLYFTGGGALDNAIPSGSTAPSNPLSRIASPVQLTIANQQVPVEFAGMTPGLVGLGQINVRLPDLPKGRHPIVLQIGSQVSNTAYIHSAGN